MDKSDLYFEQSDAIDWLNNNTHGAIFGDMGIGKSVITLTHLEEQGNWPVLVLSTKRVVDMVWRQEAEQWDHLKGLTFSLVAGTAKERAEALAVKADIYLMGVSNIQWLISSQHPYFKTIVLDELSLWKGGGARWKLLRPLAMSVDSVIGLTGTPASNGYLDLWAQMELIKPGVLGRTKSMFRQKYFYPDQNGFTWNIKDFAEELILDAISPVVLRMTNASVGMPEIRYNLIPAPMPQLATDLIKGFKKEGLLYVNEGRVIADSAAIAVNKMAQMTNGCVYDEDGDVQTMHTAKVDACRELVDNMQGQPVLIAYNYKHDESTLLSAFPGAVVMGASMRSEDAGDAVDRWNAGEIPIMLIHPGSAGHGLNLQKGPGHHLIWYGLPWSLDYFEQLIGRIHRQGQRAAVVYVHVLISGVMDTIIYNALRGKRDVQRSVLDYFEESRDE